MYQNNQQSAYQNQFGSMNASSRAPYPALDARYQPIGVVQSQYNQSLGYGNANSYPNSNPINNQYASNQSPNNFYASSFRGNQQANDAFLRLNSTQSQFGTGYGNQASTLGNANYGTSYGYQSQPAINFTPNPESFHMASYRGNQPGHDAYLRSDSTQTAQSQYGIGATTGMNAYNTGTNSAIGYNQQNFQNQNQNQYQNQNQMNQSYNQYPSQQSYHTASYRGNQPGHDAYLRADSIQPSQSQFGQSTNSFNRYQF